MRSSLGVLFFAIIITACTTSHDDVVLVTIEPVETEMPAFPTPLPPTPTSIPAEIAGNFNILVALQLMHSQHNVIYSNDLGEQTHGLVTFDNFKRHLGVQSGAGTSCDSLAYQLGEPPFPCLSIRLVDPFVKNNLNQILMVTQIADSDCHFCPPIVYGAIFQETLTGWSMRLNAKIPIHGGGYGYAPSAELIRMGTDDQFALLFHHSDMTMGEYSGVDILFIENTNEWQEILSVTTKHGHVGNEANAVWGYDSETEFVPSDHVPYFDYLVNTSGTKYFVENGNWYLRAFTEERRYIFQGGEYILEE